MGVWDAVILIAVAAAIAAAVLYLRRAGASRIGSGCGSCRYRDTCEKKKKP